MKLVLRIYQILFILMISLFISPKVFSQNVDLKQIDQKLQSALVHSESNKSMGRLFYIAFPPNDQGVSEQVFGCYISSPVDTKVRLYNSATGFAKYYNIKAYQTTAIVKPDLNRSWEFKPNESEVINKTKVIEISCDDPISVYVINSCQVSSDGYMAIPVSAWGKKYMHLSYWDCNEVGPWAGGFLVLASENNTKVNIKLIGKGKDSAATVGGRKIGATWTVTLNKGEAYMVMGDAITRGVFDISGTSITSDKAIGLISFHQRALIPALIMDNGRDHLCEMLPSIEKWGKKFASIDLNRGSNKGDYFRVLTSEINTKLKVKWYDRATKKLIGQDSIFMIKAGDFWELYEIRIPTAMNTKPPIESIRGTAVFESDKPILVMQYAYSSNWDMEENYDPFMMLVSPLEQYTSSAIVQCAENRSVDNEFIDNFMNIIAIGDTNDQTKNEQLLNSITINNKQLSQIESSFIYNNIPGTNLYWTVIQLKKGTHILDADTKFTASVYGIAGFDSYAWIAATANKVLGEDDILPPSIEITKDCNSFMLKASEVRNDLSKSVKQVESGVAKQPELLEGSYNFKTPVFVSASDDWNKFENSWSFYPSHFNEFQHRFEVIDKNSPAYAKVRYVDENNNDTIIDIHYLGKEIVSEDIFTFPETTINSSLTKQFEIKNPNEKELKIENLRLDNSTLFTIKNPINSNGLVLQANESYILDLEYKPTTVSSIFKKDSTNLIIKTTCNEYISKLYGRGISNLSEANLVVDNGSKGGFYTNAVNFEESAYIKTNAPCKLKKIHIYMTSSQTKADTLRVISDPSDGFLPATFWVTGYLKYGAYLEIPYTFTTGEKWMEFDVSEYNLTFGANDRIGVSHIIKSGGPYFAIDNNQVQNVNGSFLNDVFKPNPNFYNIAGTLFSYAGGDFMVRYEVEYLSSNDGGKTPLPRPKVGFTEVTVDAGITNSGTPIKNAMATVADINGDLWDDILIGNDYFINKKNGKFEKVEIPSLGGGYKICADIDGDGFIDCFAANGFTNDRIFWGSADGTFTEYTSVIIKTNKPTVTPLLFDYHNDGLLDIFVAYGRKEANGQEEYFQDQLFKNMGNREFEVVTEQSGVDAGEKNPADYKDCWGASISDYNNDGYSDIFVATYRLAPDLLYSNNKNGTFTEIGASSAIRGNQTAAEGYFGHGMGSDWADFNNDGFVDCAVGNLGHPDSRGAASNPSLLFKNNGNGTYTDLSKNMGLKFFEMNGGMLWADFNNDGYEDLYHAQYAYELKEDAAPDKIGRIYMNIDNNGDRKLREMNWEWGAETHGAWAPVRIDFDKDGDMDILVASSNENVKLFRNDIENKGNSITLMLRGSKDNKINANAYGSRIKITTNDGTYYKWLAGTVSNGRASQSTNNIHCGIKTANSAKVEVTFPDGKIVSAENLDANKFYIIDWNANVSTNVETIANIGHELSIESISPNPMQTHSAIVFANNTDAQIQIKLYDLSGKEILTLLDEYKLSGTYRFDWTNAQLPSGTYILQISNGKNSSNKKMQIQR